MRDDQNNIVGVVSDPLTVLRLQQAAKHLHRLGSRVVAELLDEIGRGDGWHEMHALPLRQQTARLWDAPR